MKAIKYSDSWCRLGRAAWKKFVGDRRIVVHPLEALRALRRSSKRGYSYYQAVDYMWNNVLNKSDKKKVVSAVLSARWGLSKSSMLSLFYPLASSFLYRSALDDDTFLIVALHDLDDANWQLVMANLTEV